MVSVAALQERGFQFVGDWIKAGSAVHRLSVLRRRPSVYAFVVDDEVRYVGKAVKLHSRLRRYTRRIFGPDTHIPLRTVHSGIRKTMRSGASVGVYVLTVDQIIPHTIEKREAALIAEFRPRWNAT